MFQQGPIIYCPKHNNFPISRIDFSENIQRDSRLLCAEESTIRSEKQMSLMKFLISWNEKRLRVQPILQKRKEQYQTQSNLIYKNIKNLRDDIYNQFNQLLAEYQNNTNRNIQRQDQNLSQFNIDPNNLTKNLLIEIIENYIKPDDEDEVFHQQIMEKNENVKKSVEQMLYTQIEQFKQRLNYNYECIQELPSLEGIRTIVFNRLANIVVTGCDSDIKIFDFNDGKLIPQTVLKGHKNLVQTLCYSKIKDFFISGGKTVENDFNLLIWEKNEENQWYCKQKLKNPSDGQKKLKTGGIEHIVIDKQEEQIFACDNSVNECDNTSKSRILVLEKDKDSWCRFQALDEIEGFINCMSINQDSTFLTSTGSKNVVIVWKKNEKREWFKFQNLEQDESGYRVVFLNNRTFVWQTTTGLIKVFVLNEKATMFENQVSNTNLQYLDFHKQCYWRFPSIYNESLKVLVTKQGSSIHVLGVQDVNGKIAISQQQEIPFKSHWLYGSLSPFGDYIIAYDESSKVIQVYKLKQHQF